MRQLRLVLQMLSGVGCGGVGLDCFGHAFAGDDLDCLGRDHLVETEASNVPIQCRDSNGFHRKCCGQCDVIC